MHSRRQNGNHRGLSVKPGKEIDLLGSGLIRSLGKLGKLISYFEIPSLRYNNIIPDNKALLSLIG